MRIVGITAEYNPMHTGHVYHLAKAKEVSGADFAVVCMSGSFTQRGEPALFDKWTRSRIAVVNGADLVLELPFAFATSSAPDFAFGAMEIFRRLGLVTDVAFGTEAGNLELLNRVARLTEEEPEPFVTILKEGLAKGLSFAAARGLAITKLLGEESGEAAKKPNNILAIEYIKESFRWEASPTLHSILREGDYHQGGQSPSAEAMRKRALRSISQRAGRKERLALALAEDGFGGEAPAETQKALADNILHLGDPERMLPLLRTRLLTMKEEEMATCAGVREGMEHRFKELARKGENLSQLIDSIKTKRNTYTGVARALLHVLTGLPQQDYRALCQKTERDPQARQGGGRYYPGLYARVLAAGEKGRELLRLLKEEERRSLPLVTEINRGDKGPLLTYDILAADLYNTALARDLYMGCDYVKKPFIAIAERD